MNLLNETMNVMATYGLDCEEIVFIGSEESGHCCTWKEFENLADVEYDNGFGRAEVATDLIIAFRDGTKMVRDDHCGSEWWDVHFPFRPPAEKKPIVRLTICGHDGYSPLKYLQMDAG